MEIYITLEKYEYDPNAGGPKYISVELGTNKTFAIRVYRLNSKNEKIYSDYSNEVVLENING